MARPTNPKPDKAAIAAPPPEETKVFLSYSRRDAATLQRIADALIMHPEFQPDFDKAEHDPDKVSAGISADEPWWQRLEQMIAGAEAMVFLVSPHSAASKVCDEEIAYAQRVGKRIIPVLSDTIDFAKLPPKLSALNIAIDFTEAGPGFDEAMSHLVRVLSVNAAWLREGRRYIERAAEWERKGRPKGGLLPTGAFEEAEAWAARRPKNEHEPGELFTAWIAASRANIQEQFARERRQIRRARIWQSIASLVLLLALVGTGVGAWQVTIGLRGVGKSNSTVLTSLSEAADLRSENGLRLTMDGGARAAKLALAAYADSALSPVARGADFRLGAAVGLAQLPAILENHTETVSTAAFSPDGKRIVTASWDNTASVWHQDDSGAWVSASLVGHEGLVESAAFSPDGNRIVTVAFDNTARVWNEDEDGIWAGIPLTGQTTEDVGALGLVPISTKRVASFSPENTRIVTAFGDNVARVWHEGEDGAWLSTLLEGHASIVTDAAFSPDSKRIVTASWDKTVRVWRESEDGVWTSTPLAGHESSVDSVAFSPDGKRILAVSSMTIWVWSESEDGVWTSSPLEGHKSGIQSAAFSPDSTRIVTASWDATARVWQESQDGTWTSVPLEGHQSVVTDAAFSPDGTRILTASEDKTARVWRESQFGGWTSRSLEGHGDIVTSAAFSPDGARIVTASRDKTARVWREDEGSAWGNTPLSGHGNSVYSAAFSPNGLRIVTAAGDNTARVWSRNAEGIWTSTPLEGHESIVESAAFSIDGTRIVTASWDATARVWQEGNNGAWTSVLLNGHRDVVTDAAFSSDGSQIVTGSLDTSARVWRQTADGSWVGTPLQGHKDGINHVSFSPDGLRIVTASRDATSRVWQKGENGAWTSTVLEGHEGSVFSADFSPDSRTIVTASGDNTVRFWDQDKNGAWISKRLTGTQENVISAAFSPDGRAIVTAFMGSIARVWREGENGTWTSAPLEGHEYSVFSADFSPDGMAVVTASSDATARVWNVHWLVDDLSRDSINREARRQIMPPLKQEACERLRDASTVWVRAPEAGQRQLRHAYAELSEEDLRAAPLLRAMGYKAGDDVCEASKPKGNDAFLTRWLPRTWWSGLGWKD